MKLGKIYDWIVREGIKTDLRTPRQIQSKLKKTKEEFKKLSSLYKRLFDKDSFFNPYADTRILHGDRNLEVKRLLIGIDIEVAELLLSERLSRGQKKIDLVIAHHPLGLALAGLHDVMGLQSDVLTRLGINGEIARELMDRRIDEVARRLHSGNHTRTVDAAKLLNIPLMCCHTPADNHVTRYLQKRMDKRKPRTLEHIVKMLLEEPEYRDALLNKAGPHLFVGKPEDRAGKIMVDMTGGTEGSKDIFARLSQLGINTYVGMHLSEDHFQKIKSEHMSVVIAGHMASDNLGMNLLLDKLERIEPLEIIECSGFRRVRRI